MRFDGVDYLDGDESDPTRLGWMRGDPPAPERLIRFTDDRFLEFPQNRWALSHLRELVPTTNVARDSGAPADLGVPDTARVTAIDELAFENLAGHPRRWLDSLSETYTDGIVVLHRGRLVYERYLGELQRHQPHACFSITKSYAATLVAALAHEGSLDLAHTVEHYLPETRDSAFRDATLRQLLDMQIGVAYSEVYADANTDFWVYSRAAGLRPSTGGPNEADGLRHFLLSVRKHGEHGRQFAYKSVNTDVLCWVMQRVTGLPFAELLSQRLWSQLGCEDDAYLIVDARGVAMGGAGLSATTRDMARFGELMRCEGARGSRQLIPAAVVADILGGADREQLVKAGYSLLRGYSYRSMWWVTHNEHEGFEGRGIHGQRLYIAPRAELVVARHASHPVAASAAHDPTTIPALIALGRLLAFG